MAGRFCPHLTVEVLSIVFKILYNIRIGGSEQRVDSFGREAAASRRQRPLCVYVRASVRGELMMI